MIHRYPAPSRTSPDELFLRFVGVTPISDQDAATAGDRIETRFSLACPAAHHSPMDRRRRTRRRLSSHITIPFAPRCSALPGPSTGFCPSATEAIYGGFSGRTINQDGSRVVERSVLRYVQAIEGYTTVLFWTSSAITAPEQAALHQQALSLLAEQIIPSSKIVLLACARG